MTPKKKKKKKKRKLQRAFPRFNSKIPLLKEKRIFHLRLTVLY